MKHGIQKMIVEATGLKKATVSNAMNGKHISWNTAKIISSLIGCDPCEFMDRKVDIVQKFAMKWAETQLESESKLSDQAA